MVVGSAVRRRYVRQSVRLPTVVKRQVHLTLAGCLCTFVQLDLRVGSQGIPEVSLFLAMNQSVGYTPGGTVCVVAFLDPLLVFDLRLCSLLTLSLNPDDENRWFRLL